MFRPCRSTPRFPPLGLVGRLPAGVRGELTCRRIRAGVLQPYTGTVLCIRSVGNLLQNAFKFTRQQTEVTLGAYALSDRILIDVKDHCGGLPPSDVERMFQPFTQNGVDKAGLGPGLSIARRSVEASNGTLSVRDVPGTRCRVRIHGFIARICRPR